MQLLCRSEVDCTRDELQHPLSCLKGWIRFLEMRLNAYLGYLFVQLITILFVMLFFKLIPDRQVAATAAGALFVGIPASMLLVEFKRSGYKNKIWMVVVLQFWLFFALPIMGLRVFNWGVPFEDLSFLGIPGVVMHQWSSKSYMLMMASTLWAYWKMLKMEPKEGVWKIKKPV